MNNQKCIELVKSITFEQYPIIDQWIKNDCNTRSLMENIVKDESLRHPSLANVKFNLARAIDALYRDYELTFDALLLNPRTNKFYTCFDLEPIGYYAPAVAYVLQRHYQFRTYHNRFGIHGNSYDGSKLDFRYPAIFIKGMMLEGKAGLPIEGGDDIVFDDLLKLAVKIGISGSQNNKNLIVRDQKCYGITTTDAICNLCCYKTSFLSRHKSEILCILKNYKGGNDLLLPIEQLVEKINKKTCLFCLRTKNDTIKALVCQ